MLGNVDYFPKQRLLPGSGSVSAWVKPLGKMDSKQNASTHELSSQILARKKVNGGIHPP